MSASPASTAAPPPPHEARRSRFRRILAFVVLVLLVVVGLVVRAIVRAIESRPATIIVGPADPDAPSPRGDAYAADPVLGVRPRRNVEQRYEIHPLHSPPTEGGKDRIVRRTDNLGLVRSEDVTTLAAGPRTLLVGDSHLMGVVSNADNAGDLLEKRLRAGGRTDAAVYNASCGFYSLYQEVLRLRSLAETLKPDLFVVVCFLGNDFVELEDAGSPHLDDALVERPADPSPPPETTSERMRWLALPEEMLFWQGMNQAAYFHLHPERFEPVCAKAKKSLELLRDLARAHQARALVVLLPGYDLVFPDRVAALGDAAKQAIATDANGRLRARVLELVAELGLATVDPLAAFRADGREDLYASDYHVFLRGHALLAERMEPAVVAQFAACGR
jgi:hypothetical protein